jgi:uncharacterized protein (DUF433 family)
MDSTGLCDVSRKPAIVSDPEVMGGTRVLAGTRVSFQTLLDYVESGAPLEEFFDDFPSVSRELAVAALQQAGDLALARRHPATE